MGFALTKTLEMRELSCGQCGVEFMAPEVFMAEKQRNGGDWYCPNGHCRVYRETDTAKLRKELEQERQRTAMERQLRIDTETRLAKEQAERKRISKRIAAGVCPHCNRTFKQLAAHMKCKHGGK